MWRLYCITVVLGLVFCHSTSAQLNLKVGYRLGVLDVPAHNAVLEQHNGIMDSYSSEFKPLKSLHGFDLGIRQRVQNISFEAGWKLQRNMLQADGERSDGVAYKNQLTYGIQALSTGLYAHIGPVAVGGTLDYNFLRIKMTFAEPDLDQVVKDNLFSSDFSLTYTFPSDGVIALAIQPYFRVNWGQYDIAPLYNQLTNNIHEEPEPFLEKFASYGFSIVVYNGYQ